MKHLRYALPLAIFLLIFMLFKNGIGRDANLLPSQLVNKPVPSFVGYSLINPHERISNEQLKGRVTLLNIWATWCNACAIEQPILMDIANSHRVVLIGLAYKDKRKAVLAYLAKRGNPYHQILDDADGNIALQFGVYGTPETFLIDKQGIVRYRYVGAITLDSYEKDILPRIKQLEVAG
jgi:cytochrome c biogenesis protein CcmG, thiol:disulfide interchange protein DsbE